MRPFDAPIQEYKDAELATLIDMLAELTEAYTKMITETGFSTQSEVCRQIIINLQSAIKIKQDILVSVKRIRPG